jgi:membrane protease YdiL (CAAX protease family)
MLTRVVTICSVGVLIAIAYSIGFAILPAVNVLLFPQIFWFVIVVTALCYVTYDRFRPKTPPVTSPTLQSNRAAVASVVAGALLGSLAVLVSPSQLSLDGFPGASLQGATPAMRTTWSFVALISAAITEESAFRGWIQFRLQTFVRPTAAESIADVLFVLLHSPRYIRSANLDLAVGELLFVTALAVTAGRIASKTQSLAWPIATHALANGTVFIVAFSASLL